MFSCCQATNRVNRSNRNASWNRITPGGGRLKSPQNSNASFYITAVTCENNWTFRPCIAWIEAYTWQMYTNSLAYLNIRHNFDLINHLIEEPPVEQGFLCIREITFKVLIEANPVRDYVAIGATKLSLEFAIAATISTSLSL